MNCFMHYWITESADNEISLTRSSSDNCTVTPTPLQRRNSLLWGFLQVTNLMGLKWITQCRPRENSVECHVSVFHWTLCVLCMYGTKFEVLGSFLYALFPRLTSSCRFIHSSIHLINAFQGPVPIVRPYPNRLYPNTWTLGVHAWDLTVIRIAPPLVI